ncbi:Protein CBG27228 [Caenorhabditis briggsae]|uniref:RNA-directed DNA polymerase n=1 Tax=Caenorhabditis briggsae TaxID=6238 RepID=B6IFV1_CAEBR|nr:Protein CBG27228 [Caenorhabditis briggsae]CAR98767.1 Protein CBG27228 [Caenorhabditis briggsae]
MADLTQQLASLITAFGQFVQNPASSPTSVPSNVSTRTSQLVESISTRIPNFSYDPDEEKTFDGWWNRYEDIITKDGSSLTEDAKVRFVLSKLDSKEYYHFSNRVLPATPNSLKFTDLISKLSDTFKSTSSIFRKRQEFLRMEYDGSSIEEYTVLVLRRFTSSEFKKMTDDQTCCMVWINGLRDSSYIDIRTKALQIMESKPTTTLLELEKEIKRLLDIREDSKSVCRVQQPAEVNAINRKSSTDKSQKSQKPPPSPCFKCSGNHWARECQKKVTCLNCQKSGHIAKFCRTKVKGNECPKGKIKSVIIGSATNSQVNRIYRTVIINGKKLKMQMDTGADITMISIKDWKLLGRPELQSPTIQVKSANHQPIAVKGFFKCHFKLNGTSASGMAHVAETGTLLGTDWISKDPHFWRMLNANQVSKVSSDVGSACDYLDNMREGLKAELNKQFSDVFKPELGRCTKTKASLVLKPNAQPVFRKARPVPFAAVSTVSEEIERLQKAGVISPVDHSDWAAPIVLVKKKNGSLRMCADFSTASQEHAVHQHTQGIVPIHSVLRIFVSELFKLRPPLDALTKKDVKFQWTPQCQFSFDRVKQILRSDLLLTHYDPNLPIIVSADASQYGIGAVISHRFPDGSEKAIYHISKALTAPQRNYSQIEKEAFGLITAVTKFHKFIYGRHFTLKTDHKPLLSIFGDKKGIPLYSANRLQRWAIILLNYDFSIEYVNTHDFGQADALSRLISEQIQQTECEDRVIAQVESEVLTNLVTTCDQLPVTAKMIRASSKKDPLLNQVYQYTISGSWPKISDKTSQLSLFHNRRDQLSIVSECLMFNGRIVIPHALRSRVLKMIHRAHPGIVRMKQLARSLVYWPAIDKDIEKMVRSCDECTLVTDNGTQFTSSQFQSFCKDRGISHLRSPPFHPQSNGQAERFVDTLKRGLGKLKGEENTDTALYVFLQNYRSTPCSSSPDGSTPAENFIGRKIRTFLDQLLPNDQLLVSHDTEMEKQFNKQHGARRRSFIADEKVYVKNFSSINTTTWIPGIIQRHIGRTLYRVLVKDTVWIRHANQLRRRDNPIYIDVPLNLMDQIDVTPTPAPALTSSTAPPSPVPTPPTPMPRKSTRITRQPQRLVVQPSQKSYN